MKCVALLHGINRECAYIGAHDIFLQCFIRFMAMANIELLNGEFPFWNVWYIVRATPLDINQILTKVQKDYDVSCSNEKHV